jgi:hypothetical protein
MKQISPVRMPARAEKTRNHNNFTVVQAYGDETSGPSLVDLSHLSKWEIDTANLDETVKGLDLAVPREPSTAVLSHNRAICRLTPTRALVWSFDDRTDDPWTRDKNFNDLTDGTALLFMTGQGLIPILERLTELDLNLKNQDQPLFLQGPVLGVPAKILVGKNRKDETGMFISLSRGFGQSMAEAILSAASETDLSPAGEEVFSLWSGK